MIDRLISQM